jgi:hypothetical protein
MQIWSLAPELHDVKKLKTRTNSLSLKKGPSGIKERRHCHHKGVMVGRGIEPGTQARILTLPIAEMFRYKFAL